ncbi:hypothetical protein OI25_7534 [Paraburkholderia fungorum]|uniref:Uncharacterized protein n=1 Tax=Paraburkholderia fungorum TaxID=134537 RepID=A0AAU8SYZ2_9BURK|nr:hypothetical protein OI25_7534 [Paraburkholderia fungorum]
MRRKVPLQELCDRLDPADRPVAIRALPKSLFHRVANRLPLLRTDLRVYAAIRHDLDVAICKQYVNQHAVVVLGIPYAQLREHFDSAISRRLPIEERRAVERAFDCETDITNVFRIASLDCLFNRDQGVTRKRPIDLSMGGKEVSDDPLDIHLTTCLTRHRHQSRHRHLRTRHPARRVQIRRHDARDHRFQRSPLFPRWSV